MAQGSATGWAPEPFLFAWTRLTILDDEANPEDFREAMSSIYVAGTIKITGADRHPATDQLLIDHVDLREAAIVDIGASDGSTCLDLIEKLDSFGSYTIADLYLTLRAVRSGRRTLLAAFEKLSVPAGLVLLGGPPSSGDSVDVPALVSELTHPERVEVVGEVADIDSYIEAADVVVMPSENPEPFGLIAIEAFARGRPVIGTDAGGLADIVTDGVDGWLYPPGDADALAALLDSLTREQVTKAGWAARESYQARFAMDRYAVEWNAAPSLNEIRS